MSDKWSLEALIARYELHPEFREVFVEGEGDIGVFQLFLEETGRSDVLVYPITSVSVPADPADGLQIPQLDSASRRSDVISLALILERRAPDAANRTTCIADADSQHVKPEIFATRFLLFTDYTSIESYGFRADFIARMARIGSPNLRIQGEKVMSEMSNILQTLFGFRVTNYELGWGLKWISPNKDCAYEDEIIKFDELAYRKKYLNTNGKLGREDEFIAAVGSLRAAFRSDPRMQIRGHDFIALLTWYLRKRSYRVFQKFSEDVVRHNLLSQLRKEDLATEPLFAALLARYPHADALSRHNAVPAD